MIVVTGVNVKLAAEVACVTLAHDPLVQEASVSRTWFAAGCDRALAPKVALLLLM